MLQVGSGKKITYIELQQVTLIEFIPMINNIYKNSTKISENEEHNVL